jgi:uncharacterized protein (DUF433 family)
MNEMEQILERLTSLERSVKTLRDMISATHDRIWKIEHALREKKVELGDRTVTESGTPIVATDHPLIVKIEGVRGGAPITRHAGVSVHIIIGCIRLGEKPEQIREGYPHLSTAELCEALSYYLHHKAEIDDIIAANEAAYARAPEVSRLAAERKKTGYKT